MASRLDSVKKNRRLVFCAFMTALIVVLQALAYALAALGFKIAPSLVLVPVVIGGMILGVRYGAMLGFLFGIITFVGCVTGIDPGGAILFAARPLLNFVLCVTKGTLAGLEAALLYHSISSHGTKRQRISSVFAAASCPVVNTGVFILFMVFGYMDTLKSWASGTDVLTYIIIGLVGINFLIELLLNVIIVPLIYPTLSKSRFVKNI